MYKNRESRKEYFNKRRKETISFIRKFKENKKCNICDWNKHPEILQFHHINPKEKRFELGTGGVGNYSRKTLEEEIAKCELLCPNCHEWLHYQETYK